MDSEEHVRYPDVPSYLEYVHNRQVRSLLLLLNAVCLVLGDVDNWILNLPEFLFSHFYI